MKLKIPNLLIILVLLLILATRLPLYNPDSQYFFGDEIFYKRLINTIKQADRENNPILYLQGVFGIYARPGYGVLYSPPIWLEKQNPEIPYGAMLNIAINSFMVILVYLILKRFVNTDVAILATLVVIFSISSVIYVRHMLPYDAGLVILLLALYSYLRTSSYFLFGALSAISFLTYPSYFYYFLPIPFIIFVLNRFKVRPSFLFSVGFTVIILFAQVLSLLIGATPSYLQEAQQLSRIVTQGDFMPAHPFLTEYIFSYDGYWGLILGFLSLFIIFLARRKRFFPLISYLVMVFLLLELFSHIIPKTVLYGRTVRPFYLLLLISGVIVFDSLFRNISKKLHIPYILFYSVFVLVVIINWWPRFSVFKNLIYPTAIRKEAEEYLQAKYSKYTLEDVYTKKRTIDDTVTDPATLEQGKFYLVDPTLLYPYFGRSNLSCKKEVLLEREHALVFKPYHFEGFTRQMREYLIKDPPKYQLIYCES